MQRYKRYGVVPALDKRKPYVPNAANLVTESLNLTRSNNCSYDILSIHSQPNGMNPILSS